MTRSRIQTGFMWVYPSRVRPLDREMVNCHVLISVCISYSLAFSVYYKSFVLLVTFRNFLPATSDACSLCRLIFYICKDRLALTISPTFFTILETLVLSPSFYIPHSLFSSTQEDLSISPKSTHLFSRTSTRRNGSTHLHHHSR